MAHCDVISVGPGGDPPPSGDIDRMVSECERDRTREYLSEKVQDLPGRVLRAATCLYTSPPTNVSW